MAAARGIAGRNFWVCTGVAGGVLGAMLVAVFAGALAAVAAGMGQELFNAAILGVAVAMLTWHSVWMTRHGRELGKQVGDVGRAITAGTRSLYALAIVTGVAVLREGAETVLFLYGIASAGGVQSLAELIIGGALGIAGFRGWRGPLLWPAAHPTQPSVLRHQLDDSFAGGRHGVTSCRLPGASEPAAATRAGTLGYIGVPD